MSHEQFLFFCVNIGNELLLKEEVKTFYPELTLSYSRKGFITYKNKGIQYDAKTISQLQVTFATRVGICLGKASPDEIAEAVKVKISETNLSLDDCLIHNFSINTEFELDAQSIFGRAVNEYSADGKFVVDLIALGENEVWYGVHSVAKGITRYPNSQVDVEVPLHAPSNGYKKISEVFALYSIKTDRYHSWLDFGSAPGGASLFLLDQGCRVWGIDPAKMSDEVKRNRFFNHIKTPMQDLSHETLPDTQIHWIHADLNLNPKQAIKEVLRLAKKYSSTISGVVFTVQVVNPSTIKEIENFEDQFYDWGFSNIVSAQVPSHKKEYVIIARRK